jgi:GWxTD domain-containing protein
MTVRRAFIIFVFLALAFGRGAAADNSLTILADYATFYLPSDTTTYIEFYYSLYRDQLGFIASEENEYQYAGLFVSARVYDEAGIIVDSTSTYFLTQINDTPNQETSDVRLFDYLPMKISPGHYRVELTAVDDVSKKAGKTILLASVPDYSRTELMSSDLELAYEIRNVSEDPQGTFNSRLVKSERMVVPNPTGVYQPDVDSLIYVYSELYGLTPDGSNDSGFAIRYMVKDSVGDIVHDYGRKLNQKPGESAVISNALDLSYLKPGQYHLFLEAEDLSSGQRAMASRRFSLLSPSAVATTLTNEDVQLMLDIAWYHLGEAEKIQVGDLTDAGKANLIRQFWRDKDDDPSDPINPVYDDVVRRFVYANDNFSTSIDERNGWRTDRGRIYITYGPYDYRDEEVMAGKSYPYIKWTYYQLEGSCLFVFVNDFVAGAVDYRLVHSTHPREKYDPKWKSILEDGDTQDDDWRNAGDK